MKDALIKILEKYGWPVVLQGSLAHDEAYPPSFFTFWNNETNDGSHYNNRAVSYIWDFTIYFYSTDPELANSIPLQVLTDLKSSGWIVNGKGYDVPSDEPTHTGRAIDVLYLERE